ncbi:MAG TPA: tetratricopeptide repeat protein, partial [Holophagaceae bacterium]
LAARRYFEKALALYPDDWQAHHRYGVLLQNDGDLPEALAHADRAIALRPAAEFAYVTAADALLWMGRPKEAEQRIRAGLNEVPNSNVLRSLLAVATWDEGDRATAAATLKDLAGAWPPDHSNTVLLDGLGQFLKSDVAGGLARYEAFREKVEATDLLTKKHNERRVLSVNLYFMARLAARLGNRPEAERLLDLADRLHPGKRQVAKADPAFR